MLDQIYNEFVDAWNVGQRPEVNNFVERLPEAEREEFLNMVSLFLSSATSPNYSEDQYAQIQSESAVQTASNMASAEHGLWNTVLPRLRRRSKLSRNEIGVQLAKKLNVPEEQQKVQAYYNAMEAGSLNPQGVSHEVCVALGDLLHVNVQEIEATGDFQGLSSPKEIPSTPANLQLAVGDPRVREAAEPKASAKLQRKAPRVRSAKLQRPILRKHQRDYKFSNSVNLRPQLGSTWNASTQDNEISAGLEYVPGAKSIVDRLFKGGR